MPLPHCGGRIVTHPQLAVAYRARFPRTSPEYAAVDGLIDALIEHATFDYATEHETRLVEGVRA